MSNYLNSLVARQLNRESLVQPRLPSLFEPPPFASALPRGQRAAIDPLAVESVEADSSVARLPETGHPIKIPSGLPSPFPSSSDEAPGTVWRGRQQMASSPLLSAELTPDKPGVTPPVAIPQTQAAMLPLSRTQITTATMTPLPPENATVPRQNVRQPSSPPAATTERQGKANDQATSAPPMRATIDVAAAVDATKHGVESKKNRRIVQPRVVPHVENRRAANDSVATQLPTSEPSPVVNVTIGRIEVRAIAPATPSRKQPSAKPLMSLDEYLQRRTRGGGA
jgi:hypothetical protein